MLQFPYKLVYENMKKIDAVTFTKISKCTKSCEFEFRDDIRSCGIDTCSCFFRPRYGLPCFHILASRKHFNENLLDFKLCDKRWTRAYTNINDGSIIEDEKKFN